MIVRNTLNVMIAGMTIFASLTACTTAQPVPAAPPVAAPPVAEPTRGGAGSPMFFTDFTNPAVIGISFSPKGDGNWQTGSVAFSGYYPTQLATKYGHLARVENDPTTGIGQRTSRMSRITTPAYIQSREQLAPGQNPNVLNVLTNRAYGDFTYETSMVFYSARAQTYDEEADKERAIELRRRAGAGMVFRYQDPANYYMMRTGGENGIEIGKMVNNQYQSLKFVPTERLENFLTPERSVTLRLVARGCQLDAYVDNNLVARLSDCTFTIGQVGLITFKTKAAFLYVAVWEQFGPDLPYF